MVLKIQARKLQKQWSHPSTLVNQSTWEALHVVITDFLPSHWTSQWQTHFRQMLLGFTIPLWEQHTLRLTTCLPWCDVVSQTLPRHWQHLAVRCKVRIIPLKIPFRLLCNHSPQNCLRNLLQKGEIWRRRCVFNHGFIVTRACHQCTWWRITESA